MKLGRFKTGRVYTGDTGEYLYHVPPDCIDLTVTSPPYDLVTWDMVSQPVTNTEVNVRQYNGYSWDFGLVARQLYRITEPGGIVVWVVADKSVEGDETGSSFMQALYFKSLGFRLHDTMIYHRSCLPMTHNRYEQHFEYMFVFSKGKPKTVNLLRERAIHAGEKQQLATSSATSAEMRSRHGRDNPKPWKSRETKIMGNVWTLPGGLGLTTKDKYAFAHPAMFPEDLARRHILSWSNPGDIVFDPFAGSGTVAKIAELLGRQHLGFEISQEYVNIAERRLAEIRLQPALLTAQQIEQQASGEPHESE